MASLWWGLGCLAIGLLVGGFLAIPATICCEEERYGSHAPVMLAWLATSVALCYLFVAAILIGNYFWPWYG